MYLVTVFLYTYPFLEWQTLGPLGDSLQRMEGSSYQRSCLITILQTSSKQLILQMDDLYIYMEHRYLKELVTFTYDKAGNIGNLSRMDPSLLGVKDTNTYTKNALYLHGLSSSPLLCFSLVLVTRDNHEHGRSFGSEPKEWILKDIAGVLPSMELERFVAVLGLAYNLPYVPNDSARREGDLLYLSMIDNAFCFTTSMVSKAGECSLAELLFGAFAYV